MSRSSLKGYIPATAFVMAKRAGPSAQVSHEEHESLEDAVSASISISQPQQHTPHLTASAKPEPKAQSIAEAIIFVEAAPTLSGASSELLHKMIDAMGVKRTDAKITHLADADLSAYAGKIVVALGDEAAQKILNQSAPLASLRAKVHFLKAGPKVIATYHPSYLMQNPQAKKDAWEDLKLAMRELSVNNTR
jgi:hypothetical protein